MAYLHKKFKKLASSETPPAPEPEVPPTPARTPPAGPELKHSVGSMVASSMSALAQLAEAEEEGRKNICPYCRVSCPKPSVLEKHIRTHTNERPFPCDACGFAFKTKSNLYKHRKSRTHNLKVDQGITSTSEEIIAELGDTAKEELDVVSPLVLGPDLRLYPGDPRPPHLTVPAHHLPRHPEPQQLYLPLAGPAHHLVKLPPHLSHPDALPYRPQAFHYGLPPQAFKDPGLRFLDPRGLPPQPAFPVQASPRHLRPEPQEQRREERPPYPRQPAYAFPPQELDIARYMQEAKERQERQERQEARERLQEQSKAQTSASDLSKKPLQHTINSTQLEQRINKVISQNQAIVETLDPFWKGRYMRQSSRESESSEGAAGRARGRRYSQTVAGPGPEDGLPKASRDSGPPSGNSALPTNMISGNLAQPPRPDSNIPLNLSESGRKRKSPAENALADAQSVREVWVNSLKKTGSISKMEDIHSSIEAKLGRKEENVFHPDNPEGSIIKDLLLKTRAGLPLSLPPSLVSSLRESELKEQEEAARLFELGPVNLQISIPGKGPEPMGLAGIPVPKSILSKQTSRPGAESHDYRCNLCHVTFKSLESIEIHQTHFCKNSKQATEGALIRPNSTVAPHSRPGERRRSEAEGRGEPSAKRARSESLPVEAGLPEAVAVFRPLSSPVSSQPGLLQIARPRATTAFSLSGIPTPNLSGVLTGIKAPPLFSLPGVRADMAKPKAGCGYGQARLSAEDKPVPFVLGIPGPYSSAYSPSLSCRTTDTSVTFSTGTVCTPSLAFLRPPGGPGLLSPRISDLPSPRGPDLLNPRGPGLLSPRGPSLSDPRGPDLLSPRGPGLLSPRGPGLPDPRGPVASALPRKAEVAAPRADPEPEPATPDRPQSLALTPGQFKRKDVTFSGATLVSPETPRPKKAYVLHYQNGTAYTFLGLKCSTRVFFCSIHKAQPNYVELEPNSRVSMYSNWKVVSKDSHPSGLSPKQGMSCYNSTYRATAHGIFTTAAPAKSLMITTHSSRSREKSDKHSSRSAVRSHGEDERGEGARPLRTVEGGYKSADDNYTYIRGRGRGKYICDSCGIRCKKPSMLKKHIRTHTNVRPFTCKYCNFSFKTKGNLTKHMKSKAHSKKCVELGIIPVPTAVEDSQMDDSKSSEETAMAGDSDTDDCDDADDLDDEDEDDCLTEQEMQEQEMQGHNPRHYEQDSSGLGLASFHPRFATYPYVTATSAPPVSPGRSETPGSLPEKQPAGPPTSNIAQIPEYEQVSRITRLAQELREDQAVHPAPALPPSASRMMQQGYYFSSQSPAARPREMGPEEVEDDLPEAAPGSKIWSIARLTDGLPEGPAQERKTTQPEGGEPQTPPGEDPGPQPMAREQPEPVAIKEEPAGEEPGRSGPQQGRPAVHGLPGEFGLSYSHAIQGETIPQNVTMNVKDMPPLNSAPGHSQPAPEFNIPHITKADSPLRKVSSAPVAGPEGPKAPPGTSDSPGSASSQDAETKDADQKGSSINKTQEIFQINEEGKSVCGICKKVFSKPSQLRLHVNIHYFERPFRCEACAVSFRTKGHLQKHKRSVGHFNKVNINATFGAPSTDNPRPFKCSDCMIAFRIHGHLAKHLRSKMHIMKLECIGKLPIGMYAEMERLGTNLNEIDTTDCENSLESLQQMAVKLYEKDPSKLTAMDEPLPTVSTSSDISDDEDSNQAAEIKEEPVDVTTVDEDGPPLGVPEPSSRPVWAATAFPTPHLRERHSFSSGQEDPSTDSETETGHHALKCRHCSNTYQDMKSLQIHSFLDHPAAAESAPVRPPPETCPVPLQLGCHICGAQLPSQAAFQQHLQSHVHFRPHICGQCDAGFTSRPALEAHSRLHLQ